MAEAAGTRTPTLVLLPGIVDRPLATFRAILEHPRWRWVLPVLLCLAGLVLVTVVTAPDLAEQAQQQQALGLQQIEAQMGDMTESQREQLRQQMATFTGPVFLGGVAIATGTIGLLLSWALGSAVLYFGLVIGGQELRYAALFAAFSWSWLPFFLRDLVNAGWHFFTGQMITNPGLSYFVATGDPMVDAGNPLWILAGMADLFVLWHFVLIYFLIRAARSRGGGLMLTLVYIVLYVALRLVPGVLLSSLSFGGG